MVSDPPSIASWSPTELASACAFVLHRRRVLRSGTLEVRVREGKPDQFFWVEKNPLPSPRPPLPPASRNPNVHSHTGQP